MIMVWITMTQDDFAAERKSGRMPLSHKLAWLGRWEEGWYLARQDADMISGTRFETWKDYVTGTWWWVELAEIARGIADGAACQHYPADYPADFDVVEDYLVTVLNCGVVRWDGCFGLFPGQGLGLAESSSHEDAFDPKKSRIVQNKS